jgi:hypothetical protein
MLREVIIATIPAM